MEWIWGWHDFLEGRGYGEEASTAAVQADTQTADTEVEVTEEAKGSSENSKAPRAREAPERWRARGDRARGGHRQG